MGTWTLLSLVTITWLLWAAGALQAHNIAQRAGRMKPDSHVSLAPIIPLFPLVFFAIAKLADKIIAPWGSWIIGGLHGLLAVGFAVAIVWQTIRPARKDSAGN